MSSLSLTTIKNIDGSKSVPSETVIAGSAKAWVNFNGTGTVAIRASFNVTSITDNGTGDYTANFTTAMTDANYCIQGTPGGLTGYPSEARASAVSSSAARINFFSSSGVATDASEAFVTTFR